MKRYVSPTKCNFHLPVGDTVSTITQFISIGTNDDSRWHRNDLSKTLIEINDDDGTTTPIKNEDATKVKNMHKAVMKRLLNVNSPPS